MTRSRSALIVASLAALVIPGLAHANSQRDRYIVGFKPTVSLSDARHLLAANHLHYRYLGGGRLFLAVGSAEPLDASPAVRLFEVDRAMHHAGLGQLQVIPQTLTAPTFNAADWWLNGGPVSSSDIGIDATDAWTQADGSGTVVAILDSGIDMTHPDLTGSLWTNTNEIADNGIDDDNDGFVDDVHGANFVTGSGDPTGTFWHGTHVAGIIGADNGSGNGIYGVAYHAQLMILDVMDDSGMVDYANAIQAIYYAANHGAKIINCSWGGPDPSTAIVQAINYAGAHGALVVVAAGNSAQNNDIHPLYPAAYNLPNEIAVAATDQEGHLASFSDYGKSSVLIGAPGVDIVSTVPGGEYASADGTSMAAPVVSGIAALLWSIDPTATVAQIKTAILAGASPDPALMSSVFSGGLANANGALLALENPTTAVPAPFVTYWPAKSFRTKRHAQRLTLSWREQSTASVVAYEVFVSGKRVATLPPNQTSFPVRFLNRGHYSWSVEAISQSGGTRSN